MDRLGDMRLFTEAAALGSLSAAGRKLGLSPAAASARLLKLEKSLTARLFERTTRQLRLTDEGRLYLQHCRIALQAIDDGEAALHAGQNLVRGKVRISATSDFGRNLLCHWLDEFSRVYPDVSFSLTLSDSVSNLLLEDIDLAIRFNRPSEGNLIARRLAPNRRVLCASPDYVERHGAPKQLADLASHACLAIKERDHPFGLWRLHVRGEPVSIKVTGPLSTNHGEVAVQWALAGRGIVLRSLWDVRPLLESGQLVQVLPDVTQPANVWAVYPARLAASAKVRVCVDFLADEFAQWNLPTP